MWLLAFRRLALRALPIWMQPATHTRSPLHIRQDPSSLFRKSPGFRGRLEAIRGYNAFVPRLSTSDNPGKAIPGCLSSPAESFDRSVDAPLACLVDHLDRFAEIFERRIDDRTRARMEIEAIPGSLEGFYWKSREADLRVEARIDGATVTTMPR